MEVSFTQMAGRPTVRHARPLARQRESEHSIPRHVPKSTCRNSFDTSAIQTARADSWPNPLTRFPNSPSCPDQKPCHRPQRRLLSMTVKKLIAGCDMNQERTVRDCALRRVSGAIYPDIYYTSRQCPGPIRNSRKTGEDEKRSFDAHQ